MIRRKTPGSLIKEKVPSKFIRLQEKFAQLQEVRVSLHSKFKSWKGRRKGGFFLFSGF